MTAPIVDGADAVGDDATTDEGGLPEEPLAPPPRFSWPAPAAMALALVTRLPLLGYPKVLVFDEVYYATDAVDTLQWAAEHGRAKHPPLGKWLIASGIRLFGFTPFGWRIASLIAGVIVVGLVAASVRRLTRRNGVAFAAGVLTAADGVMFTSGRLAMLDVFVALFVMLAVWFLAVAWAAPPDQARLCRWAGLAAAASVGLGASVKWSVVWLWPIVLGVLWVVDRRQHPPGRRLRAVAVTGVVVLLVPPTLYLATWAPREVGSAPVSVSSFVHDQQVVWRFHRDLRPNSRNAAPATSWLLVQQPSILFDTDCVPALRHSVVGVCERGPTSSEARIESLTNPAVWAVCMASVLGLLALVALRRSGLALWLLLIAATQWLPWLFNARESYSFYEASLIPVLLVGAGVVAARGRGRVWTVATVVVVGSAVGLAVLFYPIWTGLPLTSHAALYRLWLRGWQ